MDTFLSIIGRLSSGPKGLLARARALPSLLAVCASLLVVSWTDDASAYAWMLRHEYTACASCHADPSGGELLTNYGRLTSATALSMKYGKKSGKEPKSGFLWGAVDLPQWLLLSGSYRNLSVIRPTEDDVFSFVPVMQADLYGQLRFGRFTAGGSMGLAKVPEGSPHARAAQVTVGQQDQINLIARNYYLGLDIGETFVLRGGRLNLPFGVRIPEHTSWVREATRTDRESDQQHGIALAYTGEHFRGEFMGILGNYQVKLQPGAQFSDLSSDAIRERGYSLFLEGLGSSSFAAGVSSKVTYARLDRLTQEEKSVRQAHGVTLRWAPYKQFSLLAEADALFRSRANAGYVVFAQADYEPVQGLHLLLTGETLDEGLEQQTLNEPPPEIVPGSGEPKFGGWFSIDWFFYKQFEFRTDMIVRTREPLTILGQLHFYL